MKILTISNCHLVEHQGSGYVITNFCKRLQRRGHEIDLFGPDDFEVLKGMRGRANSYRQAIGMALFTLRQIQQKSYDIIEFYGAQAWLATSIIRTIPKRNFLLVSHSNGLETQAAEVMDKHRELLNRQQKWYQWNQTLLFVNAFTKVDGLVLVSHFDGEYAKARRYVPRSRLQVIENSLAEEFLGLKVDFSRPQTIGFCGSWIPRKGVSIAEKALVQLLKNYSNWSCKLIGVGTELDVSSVFPPELRPRIEIIPFVEDKNKLREIYQTLAILIAPSIYESFGLVTSEAMACGCAVVTTKTGWGANLISGQEAIIIKSFTQEALYSGVESLILNEPLRHGIARNGYDRVQQLRWDSAVDCLEMTYHRWLYEFRCNLTDANQI